MKKIKHKKIDIPTIEQIDSERKRIYYHVLFRHMIYSTVSVLIVVAAITILIVTLWLPFLRIYGSSMNPTLVNGEIVGCVKSADFMPGDIVAFYYNNKILVKRVIGRSGDWINITEDGTVYVNEKKLEEPYLKEKAFGECDIEFPYQVPESRVFVMGDHRSTSVDSRSSTVGCVAQEQIVGKLVLRIWPLSQFGFIE